MSAGTCPNGHESDEADYCSVCGASMSARPDPSGGGHGETCPDCGTARTGPDARYCEVCRYDFEARRPGPAPVASADPVVTGQDWEVSVLVDPSLDIDPEPGTSAPTDAAERVFRVDLPEMMIGRRDDRHDIRPEIPVFDPAVSRRHARLSRLPDGGLAIVDLASANGTAVNGTEVPSGERRQLQDGDAITMGRWTKLVVRHASP